MSKTMPSSTKEEKYRWIKPILDKEITIKQMTKVCPFSERTLKYWLASFREEGLEGLVNKSTCPKSHPDETPIRIKERIIELRKATNLCAKKLNYKLAKEKIIVSDRLIGKILKSEGLIRKYRTKKLKYRYLKLPLLAGELVEIDIKYVPRRVQGTRYYQFTAIDCATRWRHLRVYDGQFNDQATDFLKELLAMAPFRIRAIKTDNGVCFTNRYVGYFKSRDPMSPRLQDAGYLQNGKVERSHRTDQEMFYDRSKFKTLRDLKTKIRSWNAEYNNLEHCGLNGKTPNEMIELLTINEPTNVCS